MCMSRKRHWEVNVFAIAFCDNLILDTWKISYLRVTYIYTLLVIPGGGGGLSILNSKEHYNKKINKIIKSGQLK